MIKDNSLEICFSDIFHIEKKENAYKYFLKNGQIIESKIVDSQGFIDPSYDNVFKMIFSFGLTSETVPGNERILSLLNSLIFPDEKENKKFIEVEPLPNENPRLNSTKPQGTLRFDLTCKATLNQGGQTKAIDIEIQIGDDKYIINRLFKYGASLFRETNASTIVLAIFNNESTNYPYCSSNINVIHNIQKKTIKLDMLQIITISLKEEIKKIEEKKSLFVNGKKLNETGINWIKFLGFRHFQTANKEMYYLPKSINFREIEIYSAFSLVNKVTGLDLLSYLNDVEYSNNMKNSYIEQGFEKGEKSGIEKGKKQFLLSTLFNVFQRNKDKFDSMIGMMGVGDFIFEKKEILEELGDSEISEQFIVFLGKKKLLK